MAAGYRDGSELTEDGTTFAISTDGLALVKLGTVPLLNWGSSKGLAGTEQRENGSSLHDCGRQKRWMEQLDGSSRADSKGTSAGLDGSLTSAPCTRPTATSFMYNKAANARNSSKDGITSVRRTLSPSHHTRPKITVRLITSRPAGKRLFFPVGRSGPKWRHSGRSLRGSSGRRLLGLHYVSGHRGIGSCDAS